MLKPNVMIIVFLVRSTAHNKIFNYNLFNIQYTVKFPTHYSFSWVHIFFSCIKILNLFFLTFYSFSLLYRQKSRQLQKNIIELFLENIH